MLIKTLIKQISRAAISSPPWLNKHIYLLDRDPQTGLYKPVYLDLKFRYIDGRPYFVKAKDQDRIKSKDPHPKKLWRPPANRKD